MPTVPGVGLGGSADGGEPGWEERVTETVNALQSEKRRKQGNRWDVTMTIWMDFPLRLLFREAAERRGMSVSGYIRRAAVAYLCADLGVGWKDALQHVPYPAPAGGSLVRPASINPRNRPGRLEDDGEGFGDWTLPVLRKEVD